MSHKIIIEKQALEDLKLLTKSGRKSDIKKMQQILEELKIHHHFGLGNPEQLKHNLSGFWSRRINKKDRLIYEIIEEPEKMVVIVAALGHY